MRRGAESCGVSWISERPKSLETWLSLRIKRREAIAANKLASHDLSASIQAHDLALATLIQSQERIAPFVEKLDIVSDNQNDWLATFALIMRSIDVCRSLILSAGYAPACAILKQEWDGCAMLSGVRQGKPRYEKSPRVKDLLGELASKQHRLLQPIAHLSGRGLGAAWATSFIDDKLIYEPVPVSDHNLTMRLLDARAFVLINLLVQLSEFMAPVDIAPANDDLERVVSHLNRD